MTTPYVWPYYLPQQHPYFQFPPSTPAASSGHRPSRSWQGSPYASPPVLPTLLPINPGPAPVAAQVYQPAFLHPTYPQTRPRSRSFDASFAPVQPTVAVTPWPAVPAPYYTYSPGWGLAPLDLPHPQLHNLINGEIISQHLHVNFSVSDLVIKRRTGPSAGQVGALSGYELEQPATNPQMTRVRIVCDAIPQWPVDIRVIGTSLSPHRRRRAALPFLTLEDVVDAVHASLHRKISHEEWGRLSTAEETEVARAYTRRFKACGTPYAEREQQAQGVKRVDFLLKNTWFKGFTWLEPENGVEKLKLLVGRES
ncbi:hypothetical protein EDB83DRAFT_135708 [Lactarius deliciosus]|nr:hypothetical protein EDB83DRAFT_135708 [Lactarius deliciosus]